MRTNRVMMKTAFRVILGALLFTACSNAEVALPDDGSSASFVVFSDVQQGYGAYGQLAEIIGSVEPAPMAAFCCGDIMLRAGDEAEWMNFHRYSQPITDRMPLYIARGNHEGNDPASESVFKQEAGIGSNVFYRTERSDNLFFIILDTDIRGEENSISGLQLQWLTATLDSASADPSVSHIFLFMHKPLFPQGPHSITPLENADELHVFFLDHPKIRAVFAGHDHLFNRFVKDELNYITTGGGGGDLYHGYGGDYHHFVKVSFFNGSSRINIKTIGIFHEVVDDFDL